MAGYIGSKSSVVSSGVAFKNTFAISTTTTSLTGVTYTVNRVNVFHNGVRLVDGTDYTATNGTSITLTSAAENGDQIVVTSQASFNIANTYTQAEANSTFLTPTGNGSQLTNLPASGAASLNELTDCTVSTADPTVSTNPTSGLGHMWINKTSGEQYILTNATAGANIWKNVGDGTGEVGPFAATGGTVTTSGSYTIHTFTSSGTFQVTAGNKNVESLVIAGGGGGGRDDGGGGGAGGYRNSTSGEASGGNSSAETALAVSVGSYTVTIGAGGAGATSGNGFYGVDSVFSTITSIKGGYGAGTGTAGGAGGSAGGSKNTTSIASGTSGQGSNGGGGSTHGSGGGGAGEAGNIPTRNGGDGLSSSINGSAVFRGGGGGGGQRVANADGYGGNGGGGRGAYYGSDNAAAGTANTGGGGGGGDGGSSPYYGKAGGSGIVIIRYLT